jgi:type I restriction enzyme R subunit
MSKPSEADACQKFMSPRLVAAGWEVEPHSLAEQRTFTAGHIVVAGTRAKRLAGKRPEYILRYTADFTIAVAAAKREIDNLTLPILLVRAGVYTSLFDRQ